MTDPFRALKRANRSAARIARRDTRTDFKVTQQGLDSILANLQTGQAATGRTLSRTNARMLGNMRRVSKNSAKLLDRHLENGRTQVTNRYGSAIASDPNLFRVADAEAKGSKVATKAAVKGGRVLAGGANQALDIIKAAGVSAGESAEYEMAAALRERQQVDAQAAADAKAEQAYLRTQMRLSNGGEGGAGFEGAAATLTQALLDGSITPDSAAEWARRLAIQFNLGPQQKAKLLEMAQGGATGDPNISSPEAQAFTEENGMSPAAALDPTMEANLNRAAWSAFDPSKPVPTFDEAIAIAGITYGPDGKALNPAGEELDDSFVQAAAAYVQSTWLRAAAAQGKAPSATPRVASAATLATGTPGTTSSREASGATAGNAAPEDGSGFGTTKSGKRYRYIGGNPYYQDPGDGPNIVPPEDLP